MWITKTKDVTKTAIPTQINPGAWRQAPKINRGKTKNTQNGDAKSVGTAQTTSVETEAMEQELGQLKKSQASQTNEINKLRAELREMQKLMTKSNKERDTKETKDKRDLKFLDDRVLDNEQTINQILEKQASHTREMENVIKKTNIQDN